jgi:4-hydroxy-tetrahydrodipicolinate reductase
MNIALIGYGKMGHAIEEVALQRGHAVVLKADLHHDGPLTAPALSASGAEAAIEFTVPGAAYTNILTCFEAGVPVVCGTTGWLEQMDDAAAACRRMNGAFFYASNYSIGVNLFFEINRRLAALMAVQPQYGARIEETHHIHKLDAPSGTALTLAKELMSSAGRFTRMTTHDTRKGEQPGQPAADELPVVSFREDEDPGTHRIVYDSPDDELVLMHHARSRRGFAEGAVRAAEWIRGRQGVFGMADLLSLSC